MQNQVMSDMGTNTNSEKIDCSIENETDTTTKVDSIFDNALDSFDGQSTREKNVNQIQHQNIYDLDIESYIKKANADVLLLTLAPQIRKNERMKRQHKDRLIKYLALFLGLQFAFVFIIIIMAIASIIYFHATNNPLSQGMINILFAFFGTYLTSVVVELIYILKYIVEQVFDTSISSLTKVFGGKDDKEQEN